MRIWDRVKSSEKKIHPDIRDERGTWGGYM